MKFLQRVSYPRPSGVGCCGGFPPDIDAMVRRDRWDVYHRGMAFFFGVAQAIEAVETFRREGDWPL